SAKNYAAWGNIDKKFCDAKALSRTRKVSPSAPMVSYQGEEQAVARLFFALSTDQCRLNTHTHTNKTNLWTACDYSIKRYSRYIKMGTSENRVF
ncbi:MAG: hypothetical protein JW760_04525, partial [Spirochaetales bacterium]|nr:hypothetical protein [Spirochaetales bacterium]